MEFKKWKTKRCALGVATNSPKEVGRLKKSSTNDVTLRHLHFCHLGIMVQN